LSVEKQIDKIFELYDEDDFGVINDSANVYFNGNFLPEKWSEISCHLIQRLGNEDEDTLCPRKVLFEWIVASLERAGRNIEIIPLLEEHLEEARDYRRLAERLIAENRLDEAYKRIFEGFKSIDYSNSYSERFEPAALQALLVKLFELKGDLHSAASVYADSFFRIPTFESYLKMIEYAQKVPLYDKIREFSLKFLTDGEVPVGKEEWTLPDVGFKKNFPEPVSSFPKHQILVKTALLEKRNEDAIEHYEAMNSKNDSDYNKLEEVLAEAVQETHPETSIKIWKRKSDEQIAFTNRANYECAYLYLVRIRKTLLKQGLENEWSDYINNLRRINKRKSAFIETVANL
jgi:uncharacterized Zn finger protein